MKPRLKKINSLQPLKKIGCIIPASNTTLEPLLHQVVHQISDRVSVHVTRLPAAGQDDASGPGLASSDVLEAAARLQAAGAQVIVWHTSFVDTEYLSADDVREVCRQITERTGVPAAASSLALLDVLAHYSVEAFSLVTAGTADQAAVGQAAYSQAGFEVVHQARLTRDGALAGDTSFDTISQLVRDADVPSAECIVVDSTDLPTVILLDDLEHELGKTVVDSTAAMVWQVLRTLGISNPLHGWGKVLRDHDVVAQLDTILAALLQKTSASRTTIRLDIPHLNIGVDDVYGEASAPGVSSLRLDSSLNQRSLATVLWMDKHKRMLIQDDCINTDVPPPSALIGVYGVKAQVLGPLMRNDHLQGWISVHYIPGTRQWTQVEVDALQEAMDQTTTLLEQSGWF